MELNVYHVHEIPLTYPFVVLMVFVMMESMVAVTAIVKIQILTQITTVSM